ncbi:hypothetical protein PJM72_30050, partial [Mycobacterium kansasii]
VRHNIEASTEVHELVQETPAFTKEMAKKHTLLLTILSPIHQEGLLDTALPLRDIMSFLYQKAILLSIMG